MYGAARHQVVRSTDIREQLHLWTDLPAAYSLTAEHAEPAKADACAMLRAMLRPIVRDDDLQMRH